MLIGRNFWLLLLLLAPLTAAKITRDGDGEVVEGSGGGAPDDGDGDAVVNEGGDGDMDDMEMDDVIMVSPPAGPIIGTVVGEMMDDDDMEEDAPPARCHTSDGNSFDGYLAFRGIPYAKAPLSERRFRVCSNCSYNTMMKEIKAYLCLGPGTVGAMGRTHRRQGLQGQVFASGPRSWSHDWI